MKILTDYRFARVLAVVAHADDESLFCGGTLRRLVDQGCEVHVAVATRVEDTNRRGEAAGHDDRPRQHRRLIAFGQACGMIGAARTHLLDAANCSGETSDAHRQAIASCISDRLRLLLTVAPPSVVVTHGAVGEYGHPQHKIVSYIVHKAWAGPLWYFSAGGPLEVSIDLAWKRRLLDCYRYRTTQDPYWSPYAADPETSSIGPWLGAEESFRPR